jgi:hypothetical protein
LQLVDGAHVLLLGDAVVVAERADAVIEMLLRRSFPDRRLRVDMLAQPGEIATLPSRPADLAALKEELAELSPTLVLVGVSVTDADEADESPDESLNEFRDGFAQLVDAVAETKATTIVITPEVAETERAAAHGEIAQEFAAARSLRYVDLTAVSPLRAALAGKDTSPYAELARALSRLSGLARSVWRIDVDVVRRGHTSRGTTVTSLSTTPVEVRFIARDDFLPEADGSSGRRRVLRVSGLAPGRYTLSIDGQIVTTLRERDWGRGVTLREGPDFAQAAALAALVRRKNGIDSVDGDTGATSETELSRLSRTQARSYELSVN